MLENNNILNNSTFELNMVDISFLLLKRKKIISYIVGSIIILTAIILLLTPNQYRSEASILPTGGHNSFSSLKSLAGLGNFVQQNENSSNLFPEILRSREITNAVIKNEYSFKDEDGEIQNFKLSEYFDVTSPDLLHSALLKITDISMDKKNGVINVGITTKYPEFSKIILEKYLVELENFNLYKRASQAKDNEKYLANQLESLKLALDNLEDEFVQFQKVNRDWLITSDPEILKEVVKFKREIEIKSQSFIFLNQEYELAKLESLKDVPIIRMLDNPTLPDIKVSPNRTLILILVTMIVAIMSCLSIIGFDYISKIFQSHHFNQNNELSEILKSTANRMNRIFSTLSKKDKVDI